MGPAARCSKPSGWSEVPSMGDYQPMTGRIERLLADLTLAEKVALT